MILPALGFLETKFFLWVFFTLKKALWFNPVNLAMIVGYTALLSAAASSSVKFSPEKICFLKFGISGFYMLCQLNVGHQRYFHRM